MYGIQEKFEQVQSIFLYIFKETHYWQQYIVHNLEG